jgi:hypothetical protein
MTRERARIGFGDALKDLGGFAPEPRKREMPDPASLAEAGARAGFHRREVEKPPEPALVPKTRRRRTGRNAQINIKTTPQTIAAFYALADANGWGIGETFEKAVDLLGKNPPD